MDGCPPASAVPGAGGTGGGTGTGGGARGGRGRREAAACPAAPPPAALCRALRRRRLVPVPGRQLGYRGEGAMLARQAAGRAPGRAGGAPRAAGPAPPGGARAPRGVAAAARCRAWKLRSGERGGKLGRGRGCGPAEPRTLSFAVLRPPPLPAVGAGTGRLWSVVQPR